MRDVRITRLFNNAYHAKSNQELASLDYSCSILSRSSWPIKPSNASVKPPPTVVNQQKRVEKFFKKGYKNQYLKVMEDEGVVELALTLRGETRAITCSIREYAVLMEFTKNSTLLN